jgi:16S rRNA C967 or C1407 C5-methylase (RsmB/RsmF family)
MAAAVAGVAAAAAAAAAEGGKGSQAATDDASNENAHPADVKTNAAAADVGSWSSSSVARDCCQQQWLSAAEAGMVQRFDPAGPADTIGFFVAKFVKTCSIL